MIYVTLDNIFLVPGKQLLSLRINNNKTCLGGLLMLNVRSQGFSAEIGDADVFVYVLIM